MYLMVSMLISFNLGDTLIRCVQVAAPQAAA
jgi:hypothetical protein